MTPNIDMRGRIFRGMAGLAFVGAGIAILAAGWPANATWRWIIAAALAAAGGFQLFEAKRGWCIARACGIKTPI